MSDGRWPKGTTAAGRQSATPRLASGKARKRRTTSTKPHYPLIMMRSTTHFLLLLCLFIAACTNSNDTTHPETGTVSEPMMEEEGNGSLQADDLFPQLAQYLEAQDTSFRSGSYVLRESTIDTASPDIVHPLDTAVLNRYKDLLIYNDDRSKAIDLFSYGTVLIKKGDSTVLEGGEPDTEVAVIDFQKGTRRRIFFSGPRLCRIRRALAGRFNCIACGGRRHKSGYYSTPYSGA